MRILLTNATLTGRSGTETVTRDLGLGLLKKGHEPIVYTRRIGPIAQELMAAGVPVVDNVGALDGAFDVIHGHHLSICASVLALLPQCPALSVSHDATAWHDVPIFAPNVRLYAGVSQIIVDRTIECGVAADRAFLVNNGIDLARFQPGPPPPRTPRRALAFAKNSEHVEGVRTACGQRGIAVDFIGSAVGVIVDAPERIIPNYDLVFASAQSAQEALVCHRAVIAVDGRGLAGMIDAARFETWRPHNFGLAAFDRQPTAENILAEVDRYDANEAWRVGARARAELALDRTLAAYEALYDRARASEAPTPGEAARLWARHLEDWAPRMTGEWPWVQEHVRLLAAADRAATGLRIAPTGVPLRFDAAGTAAPFVALTGFTRAEHWGVWSPGHTASVRLLAPPSANGLQLDLAYTFLAGRAGGATEISVLANGEPLDHWTEQGDTHWTSRRRALTLPAALCGQMLWLTFKIKRAGAVLSRTHEPRLPGLGIHALTLLPV